MFAKRYARGNVLAYLAALPELMVFNDESHHIHAVKGGERDAVRWQEALTTMAESQKAFRQTVGIKKLAQWLEHNYSHICIAIYCPHAAEPNILGLLTDLQLNSPDAGYSFALPVVVNKNQALRFAKYCAGDTLIKGAYGILVPECIHWVVPNLILMPCLGYQRTTNGIYRLGYGGGYYDRTLAQLSFDAGFLGAIAIAWRESSCYFDVDVFDKKADSLLLM